MKFNTLVFQDNKKNSRLQREYETCIYHGDTLSIQQNIHCRYIALSLFLTTIRETEDIRCLSFVVIFLRKLKLLIRLNHSSNA